MDIRELKKLRNSLLLDQIKISKLIEEKKMEDLEVEEGCEMVRNVLKITIDDYPPKISVYERNEVVDGRNSKSHL